MNEQIDPQRNEPVGLSAEPTPRRHTWLIVLGAIAVIGVALLVALYFTVGKSMLASYYEQSGMTYYEQGDLDQALEQFDKAIEFGPDSATVYMRRGITYAAKKNAKRALADLDRTIELDPTFAPAYYNRGPGLLSGERS